MFSALCDRSRHAISNGPKEISTIHVASYLAAMDLYIDWYALSGS